MDLRSGRSLWMREAAAGLDFAPLADDVSCRVVVLGGGVTGALIAHQLVQDGVSTILVDRREVGQGSTAASTGLLQYEIDTPLCDLIRKVGEADAVHAYRRGLKAIDEIEELVSREGIDCGFARRETLYFASHWWHRWRLQREWRCRRHFGFDVEYLSRPQLREISSVESAGAIRSRGDAQIDPFRFTQALVGRAVGLGLRAFAHTIARQIDERDEGVLIRTSGGSIRGEKIVYATGYESGDYLDQPKGNLHSTYALASEPNLTVAGWPEECLIWETARPYFYARRTDDGRAIIGGGDTAFSDDHRRGDLLERQAARLITRFENLFPGVQFQPAYRWAGTFAETKDGLAYIGQPGGRPRAYFALGYGGNGITFSVIAARLIADLIAGRPNEDAPVFRFGR